MGNLALARRDAALLVTLSISAAIGCARPVGGGGYGEGAGRADTVGLGAGFGPPTATGRRAIPRNRSDDFVYVEARIIAAKTTPVTLFANDGDWCDVTEGKFRELKVGDRVTCAWHLVTPY